MNHRLRASTVVSAFIVFLISPLSVKGDENTVTACGHPGYAPWNWKQVDQIVGVCADATEHVFSQLGLKVDLSYIGPWKRCQKLVESGKVDVNICSFVNNNRKKYANFTSTPMGINENAVFVKKGREFKFQNWKDLIGKSAGLVVGVSIGEKFDRFLENNVTIERLPDMQSAFKMLERERFDFIPFGRHSGQALLESYNLSKKITSLPTPILAGQLYISISKRSKWHHLAPKIDKILSAPDYHEKLENWINNNTDRYALEYKERKAQAQLLK